jgi:hypothetical protein
VKERESDHEAESAPRLRRVECLRIFALAGPERSTHLLLSGFQNADIRRNCGMQSASFGSSFTFFAYSNALASVPEGETLQVFELPDGFVLNVPTHERRIQEDRGMGRGAL